MKRKSIIALAVFAASSSLAVAADFPVNEPRVTIPAPPSGERWVLVEEYSDEFDGNDLDDDKWYRYFPGWIGRSPGLFCEENVSVGDGCLMIKGGKLDTPVIKGQGDDAAVFDISCGAVTTKATAAHYGYYEAKVKANKTALSTTFWLARGGGNYPVEGNQPEGMPAGTFGQELDICETVGRGGTAAEGWSDDANGFHKGMNSNSHCWHSSVDRVKTDMIIPKLPVARPEDGSIMSDDFHIYGCWWINESSADFYLNNKSSYGVLDFVTGDGQKFNLPKPMGVNLVVETYRWIPKPLDEDLLDPMKNTTYYDWVRHYVLIGVDEKNQDVAPTQKKVFEDYVYFPNRKSSAGEFELLYSSPEDRSLIVELYSGKKLVGSQSYDALAGYANSKYSVDGAELQSGKKYTVVAYLVNKGATSSKGYLSGDSFEFTAK